MDEVESSGIFGARRTSFGAYAAAYDAVRPDWPAETVAWMLGSPTAATVYRVVDLGAGTGLGTRAIAAMGHDVLAVEPHRRDCTGPQSCPRTEVDNPVYRCSCW